VIDNARKEQLSPTVHESCNDPAASVRKWRHNSPEEESENRMETSCARY
jgi:hypothetical protein